MLLDFSALNGLESYQWMIKLVVPRPIGWVSTVSQDGQRNLAPFSWFQSVCTSPPLLMVAAGYKRLESGELGLKDTLANAEATGECVIQLAQRDQIEALVKTSAALPPGADEFQHAGLDALPSERVQPPRVKGAAVAFECQVEEILVRESWKTRLLIARILVAHIADHLIDKNGDFISHQWRPIARLGGQEYAELGERFEIPRPS